MNTKELKNNQKSEELYLIFKENRKTLNNNILKLNELQNIVEIITIGSNYYFRFNKIVNFNEIDFLVKFLTKKGVKLHLENYYELLKHNKNKSYTFNLFIEMISEYINSLDSLNKVLKEISHDKKSVKKITERISQMENFWGCSSENLQKETI